MLKELPLTLILRPFDFETLATDAYGMAAEGRLTEAGWPSLLVVAVGMVGVWMLIHLRRRGEEDA